MNNSFVVVVAILTTASNFVHGRTAFVAPSTPAESVAAPAPVVSAPIPTMTVTNAEELALARLHNDPTAIALAAEAQSSGNTGYLERYIATQYPELESIVSRLSAEREAKAFATANESPYYNTEQLGFSWCTSSINCSALGSLECWFYLCGNCKGSICSAALRKAPLMDTGRLEAF